MWEGIIKILGFIIDLIPEEDDAELLKNASPASLKRLSESHIEKKVWKNLTKAERSKVKYYRVKDRLEEKLQKRKEKKLRK